MREASSDICRKNSASAFMLASKSDATARICLRWCAMRTSADEMRLSTSADMKSASEGKRGVDPSNMRQTFRPCRKCALGAVGAPNARAETGGPATRPSPAAPKPPEPSGPMGGARASHCIHPDMPRGGNAAAQLNRVKSERSTRRMNSAAVYSEANLDVSAMAAGSHGDHAPVSIELGRNCGRSGTDDCGSGRQSEGAHTIANHGVLIRVCRTARQLRAVPVVRPSIS